MGALMGAEFFFPTEKSALSFQGVCTEGVGKYAKWTCLQTCP